MLYDIIEYEQTLANADLLSLRDTGGLLIDLRHGSAWLTEEGGEDVCLVPGQPYRTQGRGKVLIEALGDSLLRIAQCKPASWRSTLAAFRRTGQPVVTAMHGWSQSARNSQAAGAHCKGA